MPRVVQITDLHIQESPTGLHGQTPEIVAFYAQGGETADVERLFPLEDGRVDGTSPSGRACVQRSLGAVLAMVRALSPPCELLVLTGDLIHDDKPASYEVLRRMLRDGFADAPAPAPEIRVIAGNHDLRRPLQDAFAQLMDGAAPSTCFSLLTGGWLVVGLDTLSDDDQPSAGGGRVSPRELAWLQGVLRANAGTPALVFCHHPPVLDIGSPGFLEGEGLFHAGDVEALAGVLAPFAVDVKAVVAGHIHQDFAGEIAGIPVLATPSTMSQMKPCVSAYTLDPAHPPGMRVFDLPPGGRELATRVQRLSRLPTQSAL